MQFQTYKKYKATGIDWSEEIPEDWEMKRVKEVGKVLNGYAFSKYDFVNVGIRVLKIANIQHMILDWSDESFVDEKLYNNLKDFRLKIGDFVFALTRPIISTGIKAAIVKTDEKILINQRNAYFRPNKKVLTSWMYYSLLSVKFIDKFYSLVDITGQQPNISSYKIETIDITLPKIKTQTTIVAYLDLKITLIDNKIGLFKKKKAKYTELKQNLIYKVVTKGLHKNVEMKDSGIEWIRKIPKHWEIERGKNLFLENSKSKITAKEGEKKGKYKFFTSSNEQSKWLDYFEMNKESILFSTGGLPGVNYCEKEYSYSTDTWSIYGNKKIYLKYYVYYFESILHEIKNLGFKGAGLEHLQRDFINLGEIILPPKSEQIAFASYLDEKTSKLDKIVNTIDKNIEVLQEFKKTLINDVVTGKIKVE